MARNALEEFSHRGPKPEAPETPVAKELPSPTEVARMLEGIRQPVSNELLARFDEATRDTEATMGEVMWALAMLQARCLASAELGNEQIWAAARFAELVELALPAMIMAVERAKHADGPPNDA